MRDADDAFDAAIAEALRPYRDTVELLDDLRRRRRNVYDYILLVCARIDALANIGRGTRTRDNFVAFVVKYSSSQRDLAKISVPDFAAQVLGYLWVLPGMIPLAGRLELFTPDDAPLVEVIQECGLPITEEDITEFLSFVLSALQTAFRIRPRQPKHKPSLVAKPQVFAALNVYATKHARGRYIRAVAAIEPLIRAASAARLLYRNYRSAVIHEHAFEVDEAGFFKRDPIYWRTVYRHPATQLPAGLELQFPAIYLREILQSSLDAYQLELTMKRKVPLPLFLSLFDLEHHQYLDETTIPESHGIRLRLPRS